ncbi:hypothetical protein BASA81_000749 [Batrachochytrium salamandrivorans]|nr:hypothetical protein BASA81_000749 [Batrachochytrium salamandrivorans]
MILEEGHLAALERWLVREYVAREFDDFTQHPDFESSERLAPWLFQQLLLFPPFLSNHADIGPLLRDLFHSFHQPNQPASFLRTYLAPLVSGPILSACRATRQQQRKGAPIPSTNNAAAETAAELLHEFSESGLDDLLEELASAHAVEELRPSICNWIAQVDCQACSELRNGLSPAVERFVTEQFPRKTLLAVLKSHSATSVTSWALKFLFFRANGTSLFHQAVAKALRLDKTQGELAKSPLPADTKQALNAGELAPSCQHSFRYVELVAKQKRTERVLEVFQDPQVVRLISQLMTLTKTSTMDLLLAKGSGMVKLVEAALALVDALLTYKTLEPDNKELHLVWTRLLMLMHNVLLTQGESNSLLRDTLNWYFEWFKLGLQLDFDWANWLVQANPQDQVDIQREAKQCFDREQFNRSATQRERIPRPATLPCSVRVLLPKIGLAMLATTKLPLPMPPPLPKPALGVRGPLQDLEVVFFHSEHAANLSKRGFVQCGVTKSASIWARFGAAGGRDPIADVRLFPNEQNAIQAGFTMIPKNFNKGSLLSGEFLGYSRAPSTNIILGMEVLFSNADERKRQALEQMGYRVAATFATGLFATSQIWMLTSILPPD